MIQLSALSPAPLPGIVRAVGSPLSTTSGFALAFADVAGSGPSPAPPGGGSPILLRPDLADSGTILPLAAGDGERSTAAPTAIGRQVPLIDPVIAIETTDGLPPMGLPGIAVSVGDPSRTPPEALVTLPQPSPPAASPVRAAVQPFAASTTPPIPPAGSPVAIVAPVVGDLPAVVTTAAITEAVSPRSDPAPRARVAAGAVTRSSTVRMTQASDPDDASLEAATSPVDDTADRDPCADRTGTVLRDPPQPVPDALVAMVALPSVRTADPEGIVADAVPTRQEVATPTTAAPVSAAIIAASHVAARPLDAPSSTVVEPTVARDSVVGRIAREREKPPAHPFNSAAANTAQVIVLPGSVAFAPASPAAPARPASAPVPPLDGASVTPAAPPSRTQAAAVPLATMPEQPGRTPTIHPAGSAPSGGAPTVLPPADRVVPDAVGAVPISVPQSPTAAPREAARAGATAPATSAITVVALPPAVPAAPDIQPAAQAFAAAMFATTASDPGRKRDDTAPPTELILGDRTGALQPTPVDVPGAVRVSEATMDLTGDSWLTTMIDRIETLRDEGGAVRETRMKLAPDALGRVEVSVTRDETGGLQVRIAADTPQARAILSEAAPRLAEMADARGLRLAGGGIDGGGTFEGGNRRDAPHPAPGTARPHPNRSAATDAATTPTDTRIA